MAQQYALTLDLLLSVLQAHPQLYQIWATVPAEILPALKNKATRGTLCQVTLVVEQGQVTSCIIVDQRERVLLEGSKAFASIRSCEQVVWSVQTRRTLGTLEGNSAPVEPSFFSDAPSSQVSWSMRSPPYLTRPLDATLLASVSRKQRLALALLDGRRSVKDLCSLLSLPMEHLEAVLNELEALGLITAATQERR